MCLNISVNDTFVHSSLRANARALIAPTDSLTPPFA